MDVQWQCTVHLKKERQPRPRYRLEQWRDIFVRVGFACLLRNALKKASAIVLLQDFPPTDKN